MGRTGAAPPDLERPELVHLRAVGVGPDGRIVAGGLDGTPDRSRAVIWTADDLATGHDVLETPTMIRSAPATDQEVATITNGPNGYVAVGEDKRTGNYDAVVWTSSDGTAWERSTSPSLSGDGDQRLISVLRTTSGLLAVGYAEEDVQNGAAWISNDGTDWSRLHEAAFDTGDNGIMRGIACMDGTIVVVGRVPDHGAAWTADGATC